MKTQILSLIILLFINFFSFAQISEGGTPFTFIAQTKHNIQLPGDVPIKNIVAPDLTVKLAEDEMNDSMGKPYRVGINLPVDLNTNDGLWSSINDQRDLWRLTIQSDGAMALGLYFSKAVEIPKGGALFVYNEQNTQILGAYTSQTDGFEALEMVAGDVIHLEYTAPSGSALPVIEINEVVYFYRGVEDHVSGYQQNQEKSQRAQSCQVDVACTPERNGWEDQINSVVHFTFSEGGFSFVCSGSTVNNTAEDCKPFILTAWHCGEPSAGNNLTSYVWYWNYQKTSCQPGSNGANPGKGSQTMSGGVVRASSENGTLNNPPGASQVAGSDFFLAELTQNIPDTYNAFYAGWDRNNTAASSGVGIHHPAGSAKKISTYTTSLVNTSYNGGGNGHFWRVEWSASSNGHGVTEGGSSGSPIFNQNGRIVGQLSGGLSDCSALTSPDVYGKFRSNWDLNGTSNNARLAPWLDPAGTGVTNMNGTYSPCNGGGGNPSGCIKPQLSAYSMGFETNEDLTEWAVFNSNNDLTAGGDPISWSAAAETVFTGGQMEARTGDRLAFYFYNSTNNTIGGDDWLVTPCLELEEGYIYTLSFWYRASEASGSIFPEKMKVAIGGAQNPGDLTFVLTDLSNINNTTYAQETVSFNVNTAGEYFIGFHCYSDPDMYILGLDDINISGVFSNTENWKETSVKVFPNPTNDKINVLFTSDIIKVQSVELLDISGKVIAVQTITSSPSFNGLTFDVSDQSNGMYFIRINTEEGAMMKKVMKQ